MDPLMLSSSKHLVELVEASRSVLQQPTRQDTRQDTCRGTFRDSRGDPGRNISPAFGGREAAARRSAPARWRITAITLALGAVMYGADRGNAQPIDGADAAATAGAPAQERPPGHKGDHEDHQPPPSSPTPAADRDPAPQIPDRVLIDQDGKPRRFYTDLVKGKLVVMNSIFTSCPATCPVQTAIFAQVQRMLGDRVGRDVQMISVSLDPVTDTPERLKEFAKRFGVGPGWVFLTGPKADVTEVLQAMDLYSADPAQHTPMAALGHERSGLWMKVVNLNAPADIVSRLAHVETLGEQRAAQP
jgi:cytochrome oxidase Cu insertion factor (SCO1/SenC/PrrC family)